MAKEDKDPQGGDGVQPTVEQPTVEQTTEAKVTVKQLRKPALYNIMGTVVAITERPKGGKFKHDTTIVTVANVKNGATSDVFITAAQWKEYGCSKIIFNDNVVNFTLEECIKDVTGYYETADAPEMTAHDSTYPAFNRCLNLDSISLMGALSKEGVDPAIIAVISTNVSNVRKAFERGRSGSDNSVLF